MRRDLHQTDEQSADAIGDVFILTVGARYRNNVQEVGQRVKHERELYDIRVHVDVLVRLKQRQPIRLGLRVSKVSAVEMNKAIKLLHFYFV